MQLKLQDKVSNIYPYSVNIFFSSLLFTHKLCQLVCFGSACSCGFWPCISFFFGFYIFCVFSVFLFFYCFLFCLFCLFCCLKVLSNVLASVNISHVVVVRKIWEISVNIVMPMVVINVKVVIQYLNVNMYIIVKIVLIYLVQHVDFVKIMQDVVNVEVDIIEYKIQ